LSRLSWDVFLHRGNKIFGEIIGILNGSDFHKTEHQELFNILTSMYKKSIPIELVTIMEFISNKKIKTSVTATYMIHCMNAVPNSENLPYYIKVIKDFSYKRLIMQKIESFKDSKTSTEKLVEQISAVQKYEEIKEKTNRDIMLETITDANKGTDF